MIEGEDLDGAPCRFAGSGENVKRSASSFAALRNDTPGSSRDHGKIADLEDKHVNSCRKDPSYDKKRNVAGKFGRGKSLQRENRPSGWLQGKCAGGGTGSCSLKLIGKGDLQSGVMETPSRKASKFLPPFQLVGKRNWQVVLREAPMKVVP